MCTEAQGSEAHADAEGRNSLRASGRKKGGKKLSNPGRQQGRTRSNRVRLWGPFNSPVKKLTVW